jgi:hypothetical protein
MDMAVSNSQERVYSVVVLIFGLIFSSSFIGSISAAINELKRMQGNKSKELWLFRRYLKQADISQKLYFRATQHVNHAMEETKSNLAVKDVHCWSLLSVLLRSEIKFEATYKCLNIHPFLRSARTVSSAVMCSLTENALSQSVLAAGEVAFESNVGITDMHLVRSGVLHYFRADWIDITRVEAQDWLAEPVLWTQWRTLGSARAITACDLVSIDVSDFLTTISRDMANPIFTLSAHYAQGYVEWLSTVPFGKLSDVSHRNEMLPSVAQFTRAAAATLPNRTSIFALQRKMTMC